MTIVKTDVSRATAGELQTKLTLVATKLTGNATFPLPPFNPVSLNLHAAAIQAKLSQITAHELLGQQLTLELRALRDDGTAMIVQDGTYVQTTVNLLSGTDETRAVIVAGAGYEVVDRATPVGAMPKVENLKVTQGDADGTLDTSCDPITRGLQTFVIEVTEDPTALTGWVQKGLTKKSSFTITGLNSGRRYWVREAAVGAAGQGPWSDPATKVAP